MTPPRRIWGIETEYGITCASAHGGPPPLDADAAATLLFRPVVDSGRSTNVFLPNGGRLYLDVGSHPEYATAECDRLEDLLAQDRAGAVMLAELAARADEHLAGEGTDAKVHLLRTNVDSAGNSFGCHENYLVRRRPDFREMVDSLIPFLVTRQVVVGSGHLRERPGAPRLDFSQRAAHMWSAVSSATTRSRPLVNTRDEPHADQDRYRRLHVIVGDSNIAESATLVKVAAMDLLLAALEAGVRPGMELVDPMRAIRAVAASAHAHVDLADGRRPTAIAVQRHFLAIAKEAGADGWHAAALDLWERGLDALESGDASGVETELDWAVKGRLMRTYLARDGANLAGLRRLLLAYHDVTDPMRERMEERGLLTRLTSPAAVERAATIAPTTTRAHLRGTFLDAARAARRDVTADWVRLRVSEPALRTVMLTDPFAASDERVDRLIDAMARP